MTGSDGEEEAENAGGLNHFITKPLKLILPTISHFPKMKNTYIPMALLTDCIVDAVDVFIASVW